MAHAEKCPVCYGFGKLGNDNQRDCSGKTCHGCDGKGWVTVQDENVSKSKMELKLVNNKIERPKAPENVTSKLDLGMKIFSSE
jgi:hypothetical protein